MIRLKIFMFVTGLSLLTSCATIPQESVDLSSRVGVGLQKQHQSQISLINLHFSIKRKMLDEAMSRALVSYFETLTPSASITLNRTQLGDVATDVILLSEKNNAAKEELENARVLLIKRLNENYLILNQANSSVTGLLQSAVTIKEAKSKAFKKLSEATGGKVDLEKIFSELDDFVLKGGKEAGNAIKLVEKLNGILEKKESKE